MISKKFKREFAAAEEFFPKLRYQWSPKLDSIVISGQIDICDHASVYWETYEILLIVGRDYPFSIPVLIETSEKIPRTKNRHIAENGQCCLDIHHKLLMEATKGIDICIFLRERVYPFLANQQYFDDRKEYANGEWHHDFDGIVQFYSEVLHLTDPQLIVQFIKRILNRTLPSRNEPCLCGGKKYKFCSHKHSVDFLKYLPRARLDADLEGFQKLRSDRIQIADDPKLLT